MENEQSALEVWQRIATWWDAAIGEGNDFQRELIMPATDRLLAVRQGESVLDACCGNGNYARRLARAGATVVAFDGAEAFIDAARQRASSDDGKVEYHVIDVTNQAAMLALGVARFDAVVCSMAMMDLPTIDPLLLAVHALLKPGGRFVFSVSHPCFNSIGSVLTAELNNGVGGKFEQQFGVRVTRYLQPATELSSGIINQPEPHYTFHRPIGALLASVFAAGFVVDGFEEPAYPPGATGAKNAFAWKKRPEIPPALVARLRK